MKNHFISVAICSYNGEKYIEDQLKSIINQSCPVNQIVLCDDGSTDQTLDIAKKIIQQSNIPYRIETNAENLGVTKNFEKAISLCSGDIIFLSDQDDLWRFDKVEKIVSIFDQEKDCVLAFSDANIINGNGDVIHESLCAKDGFLQFGYSTKKLLDNTIRLNYTIYGCTMALKKSLANEIHPFYVSEANHDGWIMCCAGFWGEVAFCPDQLISYRIHGSNVVGSLHGNHKWDEAIHAQNSFERHFAIQKYRTIRIDLLSHAMSLSGQKNRFYPNTCQKAISFYKGLLCIEKKEIKHPALWLIKAFLIGSYRFRFCDRNNPPPTIIHQAKQLFFDFHYIQNYYRSQIS